MSSYIRYIFFPANIRAKKERVKGKVKFISARRDIIYYIPQKNRKCQKVYVCVCIMTCAM